LAHHRALHTLFVAWAFPTPGCESGSGRARHAVDQLVRRGHRVTVLTADTSALDLEGGGEPDPPEVGPPVRVVRVPVPAQQRDPLLNRWPAERVTDPERWERALPAGQGTVFPDASHGAWQRRAEAVACLLHEQDALDLAIATGAPYVTFTVPMRLQEDYGVPFVLDDPGSWLFDAGTGEPNPSAARIEPWLAPAFSQALGLWFQSPQVADWHRARFPGGAERIRVAEDGWDPRFVDIESALAR
jgi:hypothetical protein